MSTQSDAGDGEPAVPKLADSIARAIRKSLKHGST